jgi:hypothetical protein
MGRVCPAISDRPRGRLSSGSAADAVDGEIAAVPPQISAHRSRVAVALPVALAAATVAVCEILVVLAPVPRDLPVLGLAAGLAVFIPLLGSFEGIKGWHNHLDRQGMRLTRRTWTGARTVDLSCLVRVRRVRMRYPANGTTGLRGPRPFDCLLLTDRHGARLTVRDKPKGLANRVLPEDDATRRLVRQAISHSRASGGQDVRVSRFAAIGLKLAADSVGFRLGQALLLWVVGFAYAWSLGWLLVVGIPQLA